MLLEIAANSVTSAIIAQFSGADRLEFFTNLREGGTTPTYGQLKLVKEKVQLPVHVMLRPRGGNFLYSDIEFLEMLHDLALIREMGFAGVVFGILTPDGELDMARNKTLAELARPMTATLHRAFDRTRDPIKSLEDAIECGFHRILTSGQRNTAEEGAELIAELISKAAGRIDILPGCGITPENVGSLIERTGADQVHSTAREKLPDSMRFHNPHVPDEEQYQCSPNMILSLKEECGKKI